MRIGKPTDWFFFKTYQTSAGAKWRLYFGDRCIVFYGKPRGVDRHR